MRLGMIGLGRMGGAMTARLRDAGHEVAGYDADPARSEHPSPAALVAALPAPRVVWSMLPAGDATAATLEELRPLLSGGDTVIDGGNGHYRDAQRRAASFAAAGIHYLDAGTSGGVRAAESGYCLMVGGERAAFTAVESLFADLALEDGYAHVGPAGAGHFVKMVHNAIEYGLMQAYAEGFALLHAAAPELELDPAGIAGLWTRGSVIRSWLLELTAEALAADPALDGVAPYVEDSGEGRWAVADAIERGVPLPATADALFARFASRDGDAFGLRLLATLRGAFGGHELRTPRD